MAGQSQKKAIEQREKLILYYRLIVIAATVSFLVCNLIRGNLSKIGTWCWFGFYSLINYITLRSIDHQLSLGLDMKSYSYYFDVYAINNFVEFFCGIWSGFWYFYLIIPCYIGFYVLKFIFGFIKDKLAIKYEEGGDEDPKKAKKKKEKEKKQKVKYIK